MSNEKIVHSEMVKVLAKDGALILSEMTADQMHNLHMAVGVSGESGELLDAVKKYAIYQKPIDRENVVEELGDLEFYMEGLRQGVGITREETLEANIVKLGKRYKGFKYSNDAAQARADKADEPIADEDGWFVNTGVEPEFEEGQKIDLLFADEDVAKPSTVDISSSGWLWGLGQGISHWRYSEQTARPDQPPKPPVEPVG